MKVKAQLQDINGVSLGSSFMIPVDVTTSQLDLLLRKLLQEDLLASNKSKELDAIEYEEEQERLSIQKYSYFVKEKEIVSSLREDIISPSEESESPSLEDAIKITYTPQALFRVRPATRCASTMAGHGEAVLSVAFSPDGRRLASGSGDATVRFWDTLTSTGVPTSKGHTSWVMVIAWSADGSLLASGSMDASIQIWSGLDGSPVGRPLKGHTMCITQLVWQPLHLASAGASGPNPCCLLASSSKDKTVRVWDPLRGHCLYTLSQHTDVVTCVKWGGFGHIYTASRDRTIRIWSMDINPAAEGGSLCSKKRLSPGSLICTLHGHAHWINHMALSTDYVLRTGCHDPTEMSRSPSPSPSSSFSGLSFEEKKRMALRLFEKYTSSQGERLVSSSDDFTMILWTNPAVNTDLHVRMTGHQALVTQSVFSPDGRWIASCSFDKSIKLWDALTGQFIVNFRGHVGPVYQLAWSADSRMLVSGSKDSTLKLWDIRQKKLKMNLPGHLDEVFSVDWSPDGLTVASGGRDKTVKLWRH